MRLFQLLLSLCLALVLPGCGRAPSIADVAGSYDGALRDARELLILRSDGTFSQVVTLPTGTKIEGSGTWSLKYKLISLDGYVVFHAREKDGDLISPSKTNGYPFVWAWNPKMLIDDWESGYYTLRRR